MKFSLAEGLTRLNSYPFQVLSVSTEGETRSIWAQDSMKPENLLRKMLVSLLGSSFDWKSLGHSVRG